MNPSLTDYVATILPPHAVFIDLCFAGEKIGFSWNITEKAI